MKKVILTAVSALILSAPAMADLGKADLVRGTIVCDSKDSIENFLELKERGKRINLPECRTLRNKREVEVDKPYPLKGYTRVKLDGKKVYVDRDAVKR